MINDYMARNRRLFAGLLLFASGLCALIYQIVWLRELRLVFGCSTIASSAVLAIFLGGLGLGGAILGRFADRSPMPLKLYGMLEVSIAVSAALTPFFLFFSRELYILAGGTSSLGELLAIVLRLLLSMVVLGVPSFLMGGTLPAMIRAVERDEDQGRHDLGLLYGLNTMGALLGVALASFYLLEALGSRLTLWTACGLNLAVGLIALMLAGGGRTSIKMILGAVTAPENGEPPSGIAGEKGSGRLRVYVYAAAFVVGFVFLLMELVWYRLLAPILGGSTYTFGLILALALAGIAFGGLCYGLFRQHRSAVPAVFISCCLLEAFFLGLPLWLGDRLAVLALLLRPLGAVGLEGMVFGWLIVAGLLVLPPAMAAGFQFPVLIGLLGQGRKQVGSHTGYVYAWNTVGSVGGALAGGLLLIPLLSAPGSWRLAVLLLLLLSLVGALLFGSRQQWRRLPWGIGLSLGLLAFLLLFGRGPTAFWRHSGVGVGELSAAGLDRNTIRNTINQYRRNLLQEWEGRESGVGLMNFDGLSFYVNGKSDGNARMDAPTQVMAPLVAAILHPAPKRALVLGLGTGCSAGWLAAVDSIERVDAMELEPAIVEVAKRMALVNRGALDNPKVQVQIGDGRELLLTNKEQYDLIFSEPSNPYRAGIASLYTKEFYAATARRLAPGGYFSQWVQGYSIDSQTVRTIMATLASVFPVVETWQSDETDLLFICSMEARTPDVAELRQRVGQEPFRTALAAVWGSTDLEGFLSRYVADAAFSRAVWQEETRLARINTDDRMLVEFGFARTVGRLDLFPITEMRLAARSREENRPLLAGPAVDWQRVRQYYPVMYMMSDMGLSRETISLIEDKQFAAVYNAYVAGNLGVVLQAWQAGHWSEDSLPNVAILALALAGAGSEQANDFLPQVREYWGPAADIIQARLHWRRGATPEAVKALGAAFVGLRREPWSPKLIVKHGLELAKEMARSGPEIATQLLPLLAEPFCVDILNEYRQSVRLEIARQLDFSFGEEILQEMEPNVPWVEAILIYRLQCYTATGNPRAAQAAEDLESFLAAEPTRFGLPVN